jgi:hypothetical protein
VYQSIGRIELKREIGSTTDNKSNQVDAKGESAGGGESHRQAFVYDRGMELISCVM